jgi:hypothetical protein
LAAILRYRVLTTIVNINYTYWLNIYLYP